MALKEFWSKTKDWVQTRRQTDLNEYPPALNHEGMIAPDDEPTKPIEDNSSDSDNSVVVKTLQPADKGQSLDKLNAGFTKLVEQLEGINSHLDQQVTQHQELMGRMEKFPQLLETFPAVVENQKQLTEQLFEQLKATATKDQQFIDAVERIPSETAKQTDALVNIDHQLAAAADTDVQMAETFNKFNQALEKLEQSTVGQTDGIMQMSRTFATSDRYLKYLMSIQNRRFMWVFMTAMGVCVLSILILVCMIFYLKQ